MTNNCILATVGLCTMLAFVTMDRAIARTVVTKSRDCGSFMVESVTAIVRGEGGEDFVLEQSVRLINNAKHIDKRLDLLQHRSRNPDLGDAHSLDAVAYKWACTRATTGRTFLLLAISCENPGARSCNPGMDAHTNKEWDLIFDETGRSELPIPGVMSDADVRRLIALGLWSVMMDNKAYDGVEDLMY